MRIPILSLIVFLTLMLGTDVYLYFTAKRALKPRAAKIVIVAFLFVEYILLSIGLSLPARSGDSPVLLAKMWSLFAFMTILIPKIVFCLIDAIGFIPKLWKGKHWRGFGVCGMACAVIIGAVMWWGALVTRFDFTVKEIAVTDRHLPESFEGYRIVQFSDLHLGTYGGDTAYVAKVVDAINALEPDLIVFTGDLVNRNSEELRPFTAVLGELNAPDGVISIMGNHDYGDYYEWDNEGDKQQSMADFYSMQREMGWTLLLNSNKVIKHGTDSIFVIGVENVGDPPFTRYGNLKMSYPDVTDANTKILLTHNPAHWEEEIKDSSANILLTLSGHTHAMQIRVGDFSPAAWRYRYWQGLYEDEKGHYINVDTGIGSVGFPMRVGVTPQVSLITLHKK